MLETDSSLLPHSDPERRGQPLRVLSVGFDDISLDELERLLTTLGVEPAGRLVVPLKKINPATYIGSGKIEEVRNAVAALNCGAVILDVDLSPNQLRNLEKEIGKPTLDRPGVIIEIFTRHARTKESKTQVGLARLQYLLPRLAHFWSHFERQRGGGGGGGSAQRGMGEKQLEVDRRLVKKRMSVLRERLKAIELERKVQRSGREDVLKVALVGYTNAGKSTLLNGLTQSAVLAENKLFATLDASVRTLDPNSHPPVVAIDTVGFISRLPHSLVASFRSTLEELEQADLLVHVVDVSSPQAREELEVTDKVLHELNVGEKPRITVLNKVDRIGNTPAERNRARLVSPGAISVSALNAEDVRRLRDIILDHFRKHMEVWEILVPYSESRLEAQLYAHGSIEINRHMEKGTFYRLRMEEGWAKKLELQRYRI
jgi:GTP-binding protein HflX